MTDTNKEFTDAMNTPETRVEQPATGKTPAKAREAASSAAVPESEDADAINAKQIEEAKAAGGEYQGKQPDLKRPTVKEMATEKKVPASGRQEQG